MSGGRNWRRAATTQCVNGHAYTPENTLLNGHGWRYCRSCNRVAARDYQRRRRRSVGAEPVEPVVIAPRKGLLYIDRASDLAAQWAGVAELWTAGKGGKLSRARWAVFLALKRGGWSVNRIANETGMCRKSVLYGVPRAEVLAAAPGEFADLFAMVVQA